MRPEANTLAVGSGQNTIIRLGDTEGANKLSFRNYANSEIASLNSEGMLAMGLTSTVYKLDVKGKTRFQIADESPDQFVLYDDISSDNIINYNADVKVLTLTDSDNSLIGIGTNNPTYKVHINKSGTPFGVTTPSFGGTGFVFSNEASIFSADEFGIYGAGGDEVIVAYDYTNQNIHYGPIVNNLTSGNIGINTSNPGYPFEVYSSDPINDSIYSRIKTSDNSAQLQSRSTGGRYAEADVSHHSIALNMTTNPNG
jgi:hypothetical protein